MNERDFDVIIIGGSYAGLSAALALGRSLRKVLVIDSGKPCNRFTPHSHNFLTHDGHEPAEIAMLAKENVAKYETVSFLEAIATAANKEGNDFVVHASPGGQFIGKKLIFATGLRDIMPGIEGFEACWGKSVIHCPYCHGYEYSGEATAILDDGDSGYHYAELISNWSKDLTIFTNGLATFNEEQLAKLQKNNIGVVEKEIEAIVHEDGNVQAIRTKDGGSYAVKAIYNKPKQVQHCEIPGKLGCELTDQGLIKVDDSRKTSVPGVFACGDNSTWRSVATAVYTGAMTGGMVNMELIKENF